MWSSRALDTLGHGLTGSSRVNLEEASFFLSSLMHITESTPQGPGDSLPPTRPEPHGFRVHPTQPRIFICPVLCSMEGLWVLYHRQRRTLRKENLRPVSSGGTKDTVRPDCLQTHVVSHTYFLSTNKWDQMTAPHTEASTNMNTKAGPGQWKWENKGSVLRTLDVTILNEIRVNCVSVHMCVVIHR